MSLLSSSLLGCGSCGKRYKYKASFENHIKQCAVQCFECKSCGQIFKTAKLKASHLPKCSLMPFDFADEYFDEEVITTLDSTTSHPFWVSRLNDFARDETICNKNNFLIIHLNINSLFTKTSHIFDLLYHIKPDILALNETKLGYDTPDSAVNPANPANCVAIYIKKELKYFILILVSISN